MKYVSSALKKRGEGIKENCGEIWLWAIKYYNVKFLMLYTELVLVLTESLINEASLPQYIIQTVQIKVYIEW